MKMMRSAAQQGIVLTGVLTRAIALKPVCKFRFGFFQFVAVDQTASQCLKESSRTNVIGEFVVRFLFGAGGVNGKEFFIERGEAAFYSSQAKTALSRDRPIRKTQRKIP